MKVTLQVNGREMTFSEQELTAIVEEHFLNGAKEVQKPTENQWFKVKPQAIDQKLFEKKRADEKQEITRQIILQAFEEMKNNFGKYGNDFITMMPKKDWKSKTVRELEDMARELGDHNADWVEQALEWAQRIVNGESWKSICNDADTANWYRLVVWKSGYIRIVGGSVCDKSSRPASGAGIRGYEEDESLSSTVPLVVLYE